MTEKTQPAPSAEDLPEPPRTWKRRQRDVAYVLWISFLTAAVATMVFFAAVDPELLSGHNTLGWEISRDAGYALGFFGFWLLTASTAALVVMLVRTEHRAQDIPGLRARRRAARLRKREDKALRRGSISEGESGT
ncbi:MAG: hypothetical protein WBN65_06330 [Gammaproteobacteria bacterium]